MGDLLNWGLLKDPFNWVIIWVIVALAALGVTSWFNAKGTTVGG